MSKDIEYSDKYDDDHFEYRHVILPRETAKRLPHPPRLLTEMEWRGLGVQQSRGWVHYEVHKPEPHILLFRRPIGTDPLTGKVNNATTANTNTNTNSNTSTTTNVNVNVTSTQQTATAQPQQQVQLPQVGKKAVGAK